MYFREIPFRISPERDTGIWADRKELKEEIVDLIENFHSNRTSRIVAIWGYYGSGKSHSLMYMSSLTREKAYGEFLYYPFPKGAKNFSDIYKQAFIPEFNFLSFGLVCKVIYEELKKSSSYLKESENVSRSLAGGSLDLFKIIYNTGKLFSVNELGAIDDPYFLMTRQWLMGQKMPRSDLKKLGVTRSLDGDMDFVRTLSSIIRIMTSSYAGGKVFFWAIDDCQFMEILDNKTRNLIQQGLRDTFDASQNGLCLILSVTSKDPELVEGLLIEDLKSRMLPSKIQVSTLDKKEAEIFVRDLLNNPRFRSSRSTDVWYPFTHESIKEIISSISELTDLIPRNLMKYFDDITKEASVDGMKLIDKEFVKRYFDRIREKA